MSELAEGARLEIVYTPLRVSGVQIPVSPPISFKEDKPFDSKGFVLFLRPFDIIWEMDVYVVEVRTIFCGIWLNLTNKNVMIFNSLNIHKL